MTGISQYSKRYQVYVDGFKSQTDDLNVAIMRADFYRTKGGKNVMVTTNTERGQLTVYRAGETWE
jgi:hypothetical protein